MLGVLVSDYNEKQKDFSSWVPTTRSSSGRQSGEAARLDETDITMDLEKMREMRSKRKRRRGRAVLEVSGLLCVGPFRMFLENHVCTQKIMHRIADFLTEVIYSF